MKAPTLQVFGRGPAIFKSISGNINRNHGKDCRRHDAVEATKLS
jgi:hypothetical protein